jgi:hypothetical protein
MVIMVIMCILITSKCKLEGWGVAQEVENMPGKLKALSSNPSTTHTQKKE